MGCPENLDRVARLYSFELRVNLLRMDKADDWLVLPVGDRRVQTARDLPRLYRHERRLAPDPGDDGRACFLDAIDHPTERFGNHVNGVRESDVADDGSVLHGRHECLRREPDTLALQNRRAGWRKVIDAATPNGLDMRANRREQNNQDVENETWVDAGAENRYPMRDGESIDLPGEL